MLLGNDKNNDGDETKKMIIIIIIIIKRERERESRAKVFKKVFIKPSSFGSLISAKHFFAFCCAQLLSCEQDGNSEPLRGFYFRNISSSRVFGTGLIDQAKDFLAEFFVAMLFLYFFFVYLFVCLFFLKFLSLKRKKEKTKLLDCMIKTPLSNLLRVIPSPKSSNNKQAR